VRREWTVFPFLFRLKTAADEQRVQIDWGHEGWGWYDPDAVIRGVMDNLEGVPRLAESLRRVWFEANLGPKASRVLSDGLEALAYDYESGSRQLAGSALQTLRGVVAELDVPDNGPTEELWLKMRSSAWHLWQNGRESMGAAIMSALLSALAGMEQTMQKTHQDTLRVAVLGELDDRIAARQESAKLISQAFSTYLERTFADNLASHKPLSILTLSESSTIRQGLQHATLTCGFALDIRILESRPLFEGISLAGGVAEDLTAGPSWTSQTHKITVYSDASAALASSNIDVVLLGADRIAASGTVSNKSGSLPATLSAKHVSPLVKVVVLGESDKIALPGRLEDHVVEDNDPAQLSRAWQAEYNSQRVRSAATTLLHAQASSETDMTVRIETRNVFFEWVPARLIDAYVTEFGEWGGQQISQHSAELEAEKKRFFGSL
jgi:translation initiation factor 2B subunit (eIF-2B alpha/beta/delta family)